MLSTQAPAPVHHAAPEHQPPAALRAAGIVTVLTIAIAIVAIAFALPASRSKPHDVPIGAAGPQAATSQIAERLEQQAPGAFAVTYYPGEESLREAILNRNVYGGIAFGPQGPILLTATEAARHVAQLLTQIGTGIAAHSGMALHSEDLAPPTSQDPRGTGLAASALPITLAGMLPAVAPGAAVATRGVDPPDRHHRVLRTRRHYGRGPALLRVRLDRLELVGRRRRADPGDRRRGIVHARPGLAVRQGRPGSGRRIGLAAGQPLSGLTSAPEMLPAGWGQLGQLLPQGATATLLRSTAYFGGAGARPGAHRAQLLGPRRVVVGDHRRFAAARTARA